MAASRRPLASSAVRARVREVAERIGLGPRWRIVAELAFKDYRHERVLSACGILALAGVLMPLLVLFGLKYGVISSLLDPLIENPRYREVTPLSSGNFDAAWLEEMRARDDVEFVVPRTRSLATSIKLRAPDSDVGLIVDVELIPSAPGDPVLPAGVAPPQSYDRAVLAARTAERLGVAVGDRVEGVIVRTRGGREEPMRFPLTVTGIAPAEAFGRDGLFVSVDLLAAVEDYFDGRAVPALDWAGTEPRSGGRSFPRFRLYAKTLGDVAAIERALRAADIDVRTNSGDIALVERLDRNLSAVYWLIAAITVTGFCLSFATSVWANVDRKQREFSVLRLTGFRTEDIVWFPVVQAALMAAAAWVLTCAAFFVVQAVLNAMLADSVGGGAPVCRLRLWHLVVALVLTLAAAAGAAASGGLRAARLEPSLGLRQR